MRSIVLSAVAAMALTACGTTAAPTPDTPIADNGNDCAVIAAVAKEHYRFNATDRLPPPLWLDGEGSGWAPRCDWSRYGLSFPRTYVPGAPSQPGVPTQWVSFKRPRYDGQGAVIESGIMHGPLAGMGIECRVRSGFAGWTATECKSTWIS